MEALAQVIDPELRRNIVDLGMVRELETNNGTVRFTLALTVPECPLRDQLLAEARTAVSTLPGVESVHVTPGAMTLEERRAVFGISSQLPPKSTRNQVKKVIAVMSGKGGVGKSFVTGLLAVGLNQLGYQVGILDADITGPSIPKLFGAHGPVTGTEDGRLLPIRSRTGIKLMSVNLLLEDETQATIWRGPLISQMITQFWQDVNWGTLDHLLVDLPPGTSDAALTVLQSLPVNGIVMVTTPQALAAMVVGKAVKMAQTVNAPILGIVENMSGFVAPDTGKRYDIFGPSHISQVITISGAPLLARLPLKSQVATLCDIGAIEAVEEPEVEVLAKGLLWHVPVPRTTMVP
jgi:hydrogenase maturation protease